ncbi:MAG: hypothetical protein PVG75_12115 [Thioalkalispiraceae bacterium]|jgi:intracellular sulfur oxidation DsrE/DsrF family protein
MGELVRKIGLVLLLIATSASQAGELETVSALLARESAPAGVVFEMVGGDGRSLHIALRRTEAYVNQLRARFPDANYVIVTHGIEQFSLLEENEDMHPELHQRVKRIINDENIPVHVCGAFAEMSAVDTKDFIKSVQVAESGPALIQDYVEKGYGLVEMELH